MFTPLVWVGGAIWLLARGQLPSTSSIRGPSVAFLLLHLRRWDIVVSWSVCSVSVAVGFSGIAADPVATFANKACSSPASWLAFFPSLALQDTWQHSQYCETHEDAVNIARHMTTSLVPRDTQQHRQCRMAHDIARHTATLSILQDTRRRRQYRWTHDSIVSTARHTTTPSMSHDT